MANYYVYSSGGGASAPYGTWATAAANLAVVDGLMAAGDTCYVHPSHTESNSGSIIFTNGTVANPCKVICGTPIGTGDGGVSALQTTAIVLSTTAGVLFTGYVYVYGIVFKMTGSDGNAGITLGSASGTTHLMTLEQCELNNQSSITGVSIKVGSTTVSNDGMVVLNTVRIRYGHSTHTVNIFNRVVMNNVSFISGTTSPTTGLFTLGSSIHAGALEINGMDCTNLSTGFNIFSDAVKGAMTGRARNVKLPASWAGIVNGSPEVGNEWSMLNYSIGTADNNYRFWTTNDQGDCKANSADDTYPVYKTSGASDGTTSWSMAMTTSANCTYPATIYRSPPIRTRMPAANIGVSSTVEVHFAHNGSAGFTPKQVWMEVEYQGTSGYPLSTVTSTCPDFITSAGTYSATGASWTGFTSGVTAGPNESGNTTWYAYKMSLAGITPQEEGWVVCTVCMGVASKTIFVDPVIIIS